MKLKFKKLLIFICTIACMTSLLFVCLSIVSSASTQKDAGKQEYALQYTRYELKETDAKVTYEGESVRTVNGTVTFKKTGSYYIEYASETIKVDVYKEIPESTFVIKENFSEVVAGIPQVMPKLEIVDFLGNAVSKYSITVLQNENELFTTQSDKDEDFIFSSVGEYVLRYDYDSVFNVVDSYYYDVKAIDKKTISVGNWDKKALLISEDLDLSELYGYYKGVKYDSEVSIDGVVCSVDNYSFTVSGLHEVVVNSTVDGEALTREFNINVVYDISKAFTTTDCIGVTDELVQVPKKANNRNDMGVEIITAKSDSKAVYGGILDLSQTQKGNNLIEFHVLSDDYATMDFINVRLIDIYDPNNWIMVRWLNCFDGGGTPKEKGSHSYVYVSSSTGIDTLSTDKGKFVNYTATFYNKFMSGTSMFQFQMDYENLQLYHYQSSYSRQQLLCDLDDATVVGNDKVWKGFTDGKCYVQLEFLSVSGTRSGVIVTQIGGQDIYDHFENAQSYNPVVVDTDIEYVKNGLPDGVVNSKYSLPTELNDSLIKKDLDVERKLYFGNEDITNQIVGEEFTPTATGDYFLKFFATDVFGRKLVYEMPFMVVNSHVDVTISRSKDSQPKVNSHWQVPEIMFEGGHGLLQSEMHVLIDGQERELDEAGQVFINNPCEIDLIVKVTDYLGYVKEETFEYSVTHKGVLFDIKGLPDSVIKGQTITVPRFAAYNCDLPSDAEGYEMDVAIYINGEYAKADSIYKVPNVSELVFFFIADEGQSTESVQAKTIKVKEVEDKGEMTGFFKYDDSVNADTKTEYQSFEFLNSTTIEFRNPVAADNLNLQFGFDSSKVGISNFIVRLSDYYDSSKYVDLDIYSYNNQYSKFLVGNKESYIPGSFGTAKYNFYYNNIDCNLQSALGIQYVKIDRTANNNVFNGFTNGIVKISFIFDTVSSLTEFKIFSIGNQSFNSFVYANGDKKGPMLVFNERIESYREVQFGKTIEVSSCVAYDVLQGIGNVKISLVDAKGQSIYKNTDISKVQPVNFDKYGYWILTYIATDSLGNTESRKINIYVVDEVKPEVSVDFSSIKDSFEVGKSIKAPSVSVLDDSSYTIKIYVLSPDGKYNFITEGEEFVFAIKGNYRLSYLVYDVDYNITRVEKTITVI